MCVSFSAIVCPSHPVLFLPHPAPSHVIKFDAENSTNAVVRSKARVNDRATSEVNLMQQQFVPKDLPTRGTVLARDSTNGQMDFVIQPLSTLKTIYFFRVANRFQ